MVFGFFIVSSVASFVLIVMSRSYLLPLVAAFVVVHILETRNFLRFARQVPSILAANDSNFRHVAGASDVRI
jgi:hypothetical protein